MYEEGRVKGVNIESLHDKKYIESSKNIIKNSRIKNSNGRKTFERIILTTKY